MRLLDDATNRTIKIVALEKKLKEAKEKGDDTVKMGSDYIGFEQVATVETE